MKILALVLSEYYRPLIQDREKLIARTVINYGGISSRNNIQYCEFIPSVESKYSTFAIKPFVVNIKDLELVTTKFRTWWQQYYAYLGKSTENY